MAEGRKANTMSVELAIQGELAYRKKVASFLSEKEIADLLPLNPTNAIKCDQTSHLESNSWKLVRIEKEREGIPPTTITNRASLPALEGPKVGMQAEKREEPRKSTIKSIQAPQNALDSLKLEMLGKKGERVTLINNQVPMVVPVPASSTFRNNPVGPRPTRVVLGQSSISVSGPKPSTTNLKPCSISTRPTTTSAANIIAPAVAVPNLKPPPAPTHSEPARKARPHPYVSTSDHGLGVFCHICKVDCSGPFNYKQHLRGHKHRAKLRFMKPGRNGSDPATTVENSKRNPNPNPKPRCELCGILCSDENSLRLHFNGQKHKAKLMDFHLAQKRKTSAQQQQGWGVCECEYEVVCANDQEFSHHMINST